MKIERKFLVQSRPPDLGQYPSAFLRQGYLASGPEGEVRIRSAGTPSRLGAHAYEFDEYFGALGGLMTVEVEFETADDALAFEPPTWFGTEVTEDESYKNAALVLGRPSGSGVPPYASASPNARLTHCVPSSTASSAGRA